MSHQTIGNYLMKIPPDLNTSVLSIGELARSIQLSPLHTVNYESAISEFSTIRLIQIEVGINDKGL